MATDGVSREKWATRMGFVLAAVGSAVGLGNVWRFPFQTGQEGGAAFLLIYVFFVLLIGLPAMLVEFTVGRRTELNPVGALREFGGGSWRYVGGLFVAIAFLVMSYYSVVAGWVVRYFVGSLTGGYLDDPAGYFGTISTGMDALVFHAIFMAIVVVVVAFGIQRGIELASRGLVPALVILMAAIAVYAATLPNAMAGYAYFLSPNLDVLAAEWRSIVPAAAGQAFFTLSLGMGIMITYASYIGEDRNLAEDGLVIIGLDMGISILAGLLVFPVLFAAGIGPAEPGPGAIFVALAGAFAEVSFGRLLGATFFFMFALGALTSAISLTEVIVSYVIDEHGIDRVRATLAVGGGIFLLGAPVTVDLVMIGLYDILAAEILLVGGSILLMILVSWVVHDIALEELSKGTDGLGVLGTVWIWLVRVPVIVVLLVSLGLAVVGYLEFLRTDFAEFLR